MFKVISLEAQSRGLLLLPTYPKSNLPITPDPKKAKQPLNISLWQKRYATNPAALVLGLSFSHATHYYIALKINEDLRHEMTHLVERLNQQGHPLNSQYTLFKVKNEHTELEPYAVTFGPNELTPVLTLLCEPKASQLITISELSTLPSKAQLDSLEPIDPELLKDLITQELPKADFHHQEDLKSLENLSSAESEQIIKAKSYQFALDLLTKPTENTQLKPILSEIQAIYANFSPNTTDFPELGHFKADFGNYLLSTATKYNLALHPDIKKELTPPILKSLKLTTPPPIHLSFSEFKEQIFEEMSQSIDNEQRMLTTCQALLNQLALNHTLSPLNRDQLKKYICKQSGLNLNLTKVESQITKLKKENLAHGSALSIGKRAAEYMRSFGDYRFEASIHPDIQLFTGTYWRPLPRGEVSQFIHRFFDTKITETPGQLTLVFNIIKSELTAPIKTTQQIGVNFANGFLDESLTLQPHNKNQGLDYRFNFDYPETPPEPPTQFLKFLDFTFRDQAPEQRKETINLIQQLFAMTLFGTGTSHQKVVLLYGVPNSGKSQLLEVLKALIPKNKQSQLTPENWKPNNAYTQLAGKLLNVCGELSERKTIDSQTFKDIVDGTAGPIGTTHWFASNHLPKTKDASGGFSRRWVIIPFNSRVPNEDARLDYHRHLIKTERQSILYWATHGYPKSRNGLALSTNQTTSTEELDAANNNVYAFLWDNPQIRIRDLSALKGLPVEELLEQLYRHPKLSGKELYRNYCRTLTAAQRADELEFYQRTRELAAKYGFLQVKGPTEMGELETFYYGVELI